MTFIDVIGWPVTTDEQKDLVPLAPASLHHQHEAEPSPTLLLFHFTVPYLVCLLYLFTVTSWILLYYTHTTRPPLPSTKKEWFGPGCWREWSSRRRRLRQVPMRVVSWWWWNNMVFPTTWLLERWWWRVMLPPSRPSWQEIDDVWCLRTTFPSQEMITFDASRHHHHLGPLLLLQKMVQVVM